MKKTVLLIGANGGVGSATAQALLDAGHEVVATVSRPEKLAAFQNSMPGISHSVALDLSDASIVRQSVEALVADLPRLDAVITCSALSPYAPAEFMPFEMYRRVSEINCLSNLAVFQATIAALRRSKGRMVIVGSLSGRVATPMMGAYVASKFALEGLVDVMRQETSDQGVKIVLLQPGAIDTPMISESSRLLERLIDDLSPEESRLYGNFYRQMKNRVDVAIERSLAMPPAKVAEAALTAITVAEPETRYRVGADAEFLVDASRTKSDVEIDDIVLEIYRSGQTS